MKTILLAAALFLGPALGVIAPRTGADLGDRGTVVVEGWTGTLPSSGTISVYMFLSRTLMAENRQSVPNAVLFDYQRPYNRSRITLSIPGSGYEMDFEAAPWQPRAFPLAPFDGVLDFAGVSGMSQTYTANVRVVEVIPPEFLALFEGQVTMDWHYHGETSIAGGGMTAEVDEHLSPARASAHFGAP
jgi:hypothetical protein